MESTLSPPCSRSDPPHSRQDAALAHLDSLPLMIWYSGQTALFLFLLERAAPAFLPTALSVALRPLFPFRQAQYVPVFPLKPAPFCTLFAGLGSTNKSAISLLLLTDSRSVLATLSSPPSFVLSQTLWQIWKLRCNGHSLFLVLISLGLAESRILLAAPVDTRPRTSLISFCTVQLRTLWRRSLFGDSLSLYNLWSRPWGFARFLGLHGLPPCPYPTEGVGEQQQPTTTKDNESLLLFLVSYVGHN